MGIKHTKSYTVLKLHSSTVTQFYSYTALKLPWSKLISGLLPPCSIDLGLYAARMNIVRIRDGEWR